MKKVFSSVLLAICFIAGVTVLGACDNTHTHSYSESITPPTCTEAGYVTYSCVCGDSYKDNYVSASGHTPQEAIRENETKATCQRGGTYDEVVRCLVCNYVISSTPYTTEKLPHNRVDGICIDCGDDITQPHEHSYTDLITPPTCKDKGYTTHTCACGDSYIDGYVDKTNSHTPKAAVRENEVKATCAKEGSCDEVVRCSVCNEVISSTPKTINKLVHTPKAAVHENEVKATCTQAGSYDEVVRCSVCNEVISSTSKTIDKLAHTLKSAVHENEVKATCTQAGSYDEVVRCSVCNEVISSTPKTIDKLAHTPKAAVHENEVKATCTQAGSYDEVVRCSVCNEVISSTPKTIEKIAHTPKAATKENFVEPTWEIDGSYDLVVRCSVCNDILSSEHHTEKKMPVGTEIHSKALTLDGDTLYGKLPNGTEVFRFAGDIMVADGASYYLCSDITGTQVIPTKIAPLQTGDNTYYLVVENGNADPMTYTVTLRVRPLYTVSFDTTGGSAIEPQIVEEDGFAIQPDIPTVYLGYSYTGGNYDFTKPIIQDTIIQAITVNEEMQDFAFTSDEETCIITGILDKTVTKIVVPDYVTRIYGGAFSGCNNLESITLPFIGGSRNNTTQKESVFGFIFGYTLVYWDTKDFVEHGTAPSGSIKQYGYTSTGTYKTYYSYYYHIPLSIRNITLSQAVTSIGKEVFNNCSRLTNIVIPDSVTSVGESAFNGCDSLIEIESGIQYVDGWATYCNENVTKVTLRPNTRGISDKIFEKCSSLTSIIIDENSTKYASQDGILYNKDKTEFIHIPKAIMGAVTIPDSVIIIGREAFEKCYSLTSITIPNSVTSIEYRAFSGCSSLTDIAIGNGVTSVETWTFENCSSLINIIIPDSVTSIEYGAFSGCSSLTSIMIGNGVKNIETLAFKNCNSLDTVYYKGIAEEWKKIDINNRYDANSNFTSATRYYYSEAEPELNEEGTAYNGNYWCYNENGEVKVWLYVENTNEVQ